MAMMARGAKEEALLIGARYREALDAIGENPEILKHLDFQTRKMAERAVEKDPMALEHVWLENRTRKMAEGAVGRNFLAAAFAWGDDGGIAKPYLTPGTPESERARREKRPIGECMAAVRANPMILASIGNQTPEMCAAAVDRNPFAIALVDDQTPELCAMAVVEGDWRALGMVREQTRELCELALRMSPEAARYVGIDPGQAPRM